MPSEPSEPTDTPTYRDRRREELTRQVLDIARAHLVSHGAEGLSLRAIAREIGISVSALYRYFRSRDDLLTALLVESFDAQADAVDDAVRDVDRSGGTLVDQMRAAYAAYRSWSVAHPSEFALCYGAPVPGYAAPGEQTIRAGTRVAGTLLDLLGRAQDAGLVDHRTIRASEASIDERTRAQLADLINRRGYPLEMPLLLLGIDSFVRVHGFVVMEVFGQLRPIVTDADGYFARTLDQVIADLGVG